MKDKKTRIIVYSIIGLWLLILVGLYAYFDPSGSKYFPRCPFYVITGLHCPGCGSQRAIHQLLQFDLAGAWRYNPLIFFVITIVVYQGIINLYNKYHPLRPWKSLLYVPIVPKIVMVFVVLYWIARNIPAYPFNTLAPG